MNNPFDDLFGKAKKMQEQMQDKVKKMQDELHNAQVTGESGAGLVRVTMNGRHDVVRVHIESSLLKEDKGVLEDLLAAAVNDAVHKVEENNKTNLAKLAPGFNLNIPDDFNPFKKV